MTALLDRLIPKKFNGRERFRKTEVLEILGISERTLENEEAQGSITGIKTAERVIWYPRICLEEYLRSKNPKLSAR